MAAPNAPMPLALQVKQGGQIQVTIVLRGMGPSPTFADGGTTFNSGDPTATFTMNIPTSNYTTSGTASITNNAAYELCSLVERMWREGNFTVT